MAEDIAGVRIDKWLWAARFFRTRSLAKQAVEGGRVHLNGQRVKPARTIKPGDQLTVGRGEDLLELSVLVLGQKRVGARVAASWYEESVDSIARREQAAEARRLQRQVDGAPSGRPDKRQRRQIRKFRDR